MKKLVSPVTGKILKINVKVGQVINEDDDVIIIKAIDQDSARCGRRALNASEHDEHEEFPRYRALYEYSVCNESLDLLAKLISDNQAEHAV